MELRNKHILIISPQAWGKMFISKHHYALELARRGNKVYYLNPPAQRGERGPAVALKPSGVHENLVLIDHRLFFPFILKFHALPLFHFLMRFHVKKIMKAIPEQLDIVWSFDLGNLYPLHFFKKIPLRVFHPVDEPLTAPAIQAAAGAHVVFSVTQEILSKYHAYPVPRHFINHGVGNGFLAQQPAGAREKNIRVGFSGNLLRNDIDRPVLLQIISENPHITFECWGSYLLHQTNIGGNADPETEKFISALQSYPHVVLHGPVPSEQLASDMQRMDAFLICYDIHKDQSKGTNYHKIMEFLATGKVVISNNVTTYKDQPDLIQMPASREDNHALPALFKQVTADLSVYNSPELQKHRRDFAMENTYPRQLERIEQLLNGTPFQ